MPVGPDDIGLLEHCLGGENDVGLTSGIGEELIDHDPEVEGAKRLQHHVGVRILRDRVSAFHPGHAQRRVRLVQHVLPEAGGGDGHADHAIRRARRIAGHRIADLVEDVALQVGIHPPGARPADVPGERQQGEDRADGLPRVRVPLHAVAGGDGHRPGGANQAGQLQDAVRGDIRDLSRPLGGALEGQGRKLLEPGHAVPDERFVHRSRPDDLAAQGEGQCPVTAGPRAEPQIGRLGALGAARIDHHQAPARLSRLLDERHLVDIGLGRVLAPHDDQARPGDVPGHAVAIVTQREAGRLESGRPAQVPIGGRAAPVQAPECQTGPVQQTLGAAAGVVKQALRSIGLTDARQLVGDLIQGLVPSDGLESARRGSAKRREKSVGRPDSLDVAEALQAHAFGRGPVSGMGLDAPDRSIFHVHAHAARAVAVPGTCRRVHRHPSRAPGVGSRLPLYVMV